MPPSAINMLIFSNIFHSGIINSNIFSMFPLINILIKLDSTWELEKLSFTEKLTKAKKNF